MPRYCFKIQFEFDSIDDLGAKLMVVPLRAITKVCLDVPITKEVLVKHGTSENILLRGKTNAQG